MLSILLGVALAATFFYTLFVKPLDYWKKRGVRQGKPLWLLGDSWGPLFRKQSFPEMVQYVYNQCPGTRYSGMYQFIMPTLVVKEPELIKQMSVRDFDHFVDHRGIFPENSDRLWSKGLLALKGQEWRDMRTLLSPSFTSNKMKTMFALMTECAEKFLEYFLKKDDKMLTIEMKDVFTRFTNDVIATTAFGIEVDSLAARNNEFYLMAKKCTDFSGVWKNIKISMHLIIPLFSKVFKMYFYDSEGRSFFSKLINETIQTREEKGILRHDMIHLFMEARKGTEKYEKTGTEPDMGKQKISKDITNEDITAQALLFLFAGFDSVSDLMCFTAHELAVNLDIQERLRKEIYTTLEEDGGKLTYDGLLKMKYMDMVMSETLRKWPAFPAADRVCTKPYIIQPATPEEEPLYLEKGTVIWFPIFAMHHDPNIYPDPERFDPERFSDEKKEDIKPYTYFPFGVGPRICIGSRFALLEAKVILFYVLQYFQFVPVEKTQIPMELSKEGFSVTAANGFWLGLKRIK